MNLRRDPGIEAVLALKFRDEGATPDIRRKIDWRGVSAEYVTINGARQFDYGWTGHANYVALHDLMLQDGETVLSDLPKARVLDLRDTLTFIPRDHRVSGWSSLRPRLHRFTALYYDPDLLPEELQEPMPAGTERPMLYFHDDNLRLTLGKIQRLLSDPTPADSVYAETLALTAAIELARANVARPSAPTSRGLGTAKLLRVLEFISENLHRDISLGELAGVANLSRFHFLRSFKKEVGAAPHQYIVRSRVARARTLLTSSDMAMREISDQAGFGSPAQFSATFRKVTGMTPGLFRRSYR